jgi:UDP-glucose 4-epimerase
VIKILTNKKIVVTGGTGFIGSRIISALKDQGVDVIVSKDDILDTERMKEVFAGAWAVVHQAGLPPIPLSVKDPLSSHRVNVTGTLSVFVAASSIRSGICARRSAPGSNQNWGSRDRSPIFRRKGFPSTGGG